ACREAELITADSVTLREPGQGEVGLKMILGAPNARIVVFERVLCRVKLRTLCQPLLHGCTSVNGSQFAFGFRPLRQTPIESLNICVLIDSNCQTQIVLYLFNQVFRLDDLDPA